MLTENVTVNQVLPVIAERPCFFSLKLVSLGT